MLVFIKLCHEIVSNENARKRHCVHITLEVKILLNFASVVLRIVARGDK